MLLCYYLLCFSCSKVTEDFSSIEKQYFTNEENISFSLEGGESGPEETVCNCSISIIDVELEEDPVGCPNVWSLIIPENFCGSIHPLFSMEIYPLECPNPAPPSQFAYQSFNFFTPNPFNCSIQPNSSFSIFSNLIGLDPNSNCFPCMGAPQGTITFMVHCNQSNAIGFLGCTDDPLGFGYITGEIQGTFEEIFGGNNGSFFDFGVDLDECCRPTLN